jgi:hypothetical protein
MAYCAVLSAEVLTKAEAQGAKEKASCRIWAILPSLAFHSVTPPNEEVAK